MIDTGTQALSYFNTKALSNSLMGIYEEDYYQFVSYWVYNNPLKQLDDDSLVLGSIVDTILCDESKLEERFQVYNGNAPTGQTLKFIKALINTTDCNFEVAYEVVKAQNEGKLRDKIDKFKLEFDNNKDYYEVLLNADKKVISTPMLDRATQIVREARTHKFTRTLINAESTDKIEIFYQVEIFIEINGIKVKGAIDKLIVDHNKKRIISIDFKTSATADEFINSTIKYRYFRQGSFYKRLLLDWMKDNNLEDYAVMDFIFIVMSSIRSNHHFLYKLNSQDCKLAEIGGYLYTGEYIKGWQEIINEVKYLTDLKDWTYPYEIASNNGLIELDIFKKD